MKPKFGYGNDCWFGHQHVGRPYKNTCHQTIDWLIVILFKITCDEDFSTYPFRTHPHGNHRGQRRRVKILPSREVQITSSVYEINTNKKTSKK
jgi:hypothetical protein